MLRNDKSVLDMGRVNMLALAYYKPTLKDPQHFTQRIMNKILFLCT